ncbi:metal-sensing transcriptional repressor [Intestinibaculum porci]|uniref:metal-sensing transcriptional repressor n=1 Tax=Intestinibaculum porci TaxID=2487118 RepID=UPI00240A309B|nr:metal-sensing transcriptional repressor [Intestinibaculum porci]MDD6349046.1 metal-sensing transcriptional repressor [Intestinibaculum porci]
MKADHKKVERYLKTARGQIDGILKMMEDDRYCIDISTQLMATIGLLKKANNEILAAHMRSCVLEAVDEEKREEKIEEMVKVIDKLAQ